MATAFKVGDLCINTQVVHADIWKAVHNTTGPMRIKRIKERLSYISVSFLEEDGSDDYRSGEWWDIDFIAKVKCSQMDLSGIEIVAKLKGSLKPLVLRARRG